MSLYSAFKTNPDYEKNGIEIQYGENSKGADIVFRIARAGGANQAFNKAMEVATKPYRRQIQNGTFDNKTADKLYMDVFIQTVLLGWEGVEDSEGKEMKFTTENAKKLFTDLPELFSDLRDQAANMSLFRQQELAEDLGNSGRS